MLAKWSVITQILYGWLVPILYLEAHHFVRTRSSGIIQKYCFSDASSLPLPKRCLGFTSPKTQTQPPHLLTLLQWSSTMPGASHHPLITHSQCYWSLSPLPSNSNLSFSMWFQALQTPTSEHHNLVQWKMTVNTAFVLLPSLIVCQSSLYLNCLANNIHIANSPVIKF